MVQIVQISKEWGWGGDRGEELVEEETEGEEEMEEEVEKEEGGGRRS